MTSSSSSSSDSVVLVVDVLVLPTSQPGRLLRAAEVAEARVSPASPDLRLKGAAFGFVLGHPEDGGFCRFRKPK